MNLAFDILRQTLNDIFSDLRGALVCLVPSLIAWVLFVSVMNRFGIFLPFDTVNWTVESSKPDNEYLMAAIWSGLIAVFVASAWSAVAWHRKIILSERISIFPRWTGGRIAGYLGRSVLVGLLIMVLMAVMFAASWVVNVPIFPTQPPQGDGNFSTGVGPMDFSLKSMLIWFLLNAVIGGLSFRLSLILPAGAIDRPLGFSAVWRQTSGHFLRLFVPLGVMFALIDWGVIWLRPLCLSGVCFTFFPGLL